MYVRIESLVFDFCSISKSFTSAYTDNLVSPVCLLMWIRSLRKKDALFYIQFYNYSLSLSLILHVLNLSLRKCRQAYFVTSRYRCRKKARLRRFFFGNLNAPLLSSIAISRVLRIIFAKSAALQ